MNKDYTIVIHTDTPSNFDKMERHLLGSWNMTMTNETTGDSWTKAAEAPETSTTAPVSFAVVEDEDDEERFVTHHPACVKYGDDSQCDACNR